MTEAWFGLARCDPAVQGVVGWRDLSNRLVSPGPNRGCRRRHSERRLGLTLCKPASLGVQAEVMALEARLRRHRLVGCPLLFDVLADDADRRSTTGRSEVGRGPKDSLPVSTHQFGTHLPKASAGHPFEAVHQRRHRDLGRIVHQQMHMIVLSIHLDQFSLEVLAHAGEDHTEIGDRCLGEHAPSILCDEDQVNVY
jgi:hypothetical protein